MLASPSPAFLPSRACAGDGRDRWSDVGEDIQRRNFEVGRVEPCAQRGEVLMQIEGVAGGYGVATFSCRVGLDRSRSGEDDAFGFPAPRITGTPPHAGKDALDADRKSVVEGKSVSVRVDSGGRLNIKKKKEI